MNKGDVDSQVRGLGQSYFLAMPILAVLGGTNPNGESRLDHNSRDITSTFRISVARRNSAATLIGW